MASRRDIKSKKKQEKPGARERITEILELPKEIVLDIPKITMIGASDLIIENYKGIIEYSEDKIRVNTGIGIIKIIGINLIIKEITSEDILVNGIISCLEIIK